MRHFVLIIPLLAAALLSGCFCGDDRIPSSIAVELAEPLAFGTYALAVCVDDRCIEFNDLSANGEATVDGLNYLNITDDGIHYSAFVAIAPGQHRVRLALDDPVGNVLSFDGDLDFEQVDRCHDTDSRATVKADQLTVGSVKGG